MRFRLSLLSASCGPIMWRKKSNQMLKDMFGLTDEEIAIVEGRAPAEAANAPQPETGGRSGAHAPHRGRVAEPAALGDEVLE